MTNLPLIFQVPPTFNARGHPVGERKYHLETFNTDISSKALPLAYSFERQNSDGTSTLPNSSKICDFKDFPATNTEPAIRLSCFHTIHLSCYNLSNSKCPVCTSPLVEEMKKVSRSFNQSLLEPTKQSSSSSQLPDTNENSGRDDDEEVVINSNNETSMSSQSDVWQRKIDETLESFTVPQPQQPRQTPQQAQPQQPRQNQQQAQSQQPRQTRDVMDYHCRKI